jgi:hypothetical protein
MFFDTQDWNVAEGDLLTVTHWDCEGIEMPWGFHLSVIQGLGEISSARFRSLMRRPGIKVALEPGETCVAFRLYLRDHPSIDAVCEVLIRGTKLGVPVRFLKTQV